MKFRCTVLNPKPGPAKTCGKAAVSFRPDKGERGYLVAHCKQHAGPSDSPIKQAPEEAWQ